MTRKKDVWNFHHDGRITIAKGGGSKKALLEHVRAIAPTLILNEEIFLGSLPEAVLTWEHVRDFLARFTAYTWFIRRYLSSDPLFPIVHKRFMISQCKDGFQAKLRSSRSGITLRMSPLGIGP